MIDESFNPLLLLYEFFGVLSDLARLLWGFLFDEITIGTWSFRPIYVLGTALIVVLIAARIVKQFVPLA